jgi:putative FmdB family regulatory protein
MPIYEYRCAACGHHMDALQKMSEAPLRKCPECGKSQLRRLVSAPQFRLKGSGWYETDFKDKNEKKRNLVGGESDSSGDSAADTGAKEEAKKEVPETKADAKADAPKADGAAKPKPKAKPVAKSTAPKKTAKPKTGRSARA